MISSNLWKKMNHPKVYSVTHLHFIGTSPLEPRGLEDNSNSTPRRFLQVQSRFFIDCIRKDSLGSVKIPQISGIINDTDQSELTDAFKKWTVLLVGSKDSGMSSGDDKDIVQNVHDKHQKFQTIMGIFYRPIGLVHSLE